MEQHYEVMISFQELNDDTWKFGTVYADAERPLENVEDLKELARQIGLAHNYSKVVINSTIPPMNNIEDVLARKTTNSFGQVVDGGDVEKS